jgi:tetratricopeptide (TPR) repeat protein
MTNETDLQLCVAYLTDLEAEMEARGNDGDPHVRTGAREDMRHQLGHVRELIAKLERDAPHVECQHDYDGRDVTIDLEEARIWCHIVEAKIMAICYGDTRSAAGWMRKAIAINPERARNHALLAVFLSDAGEHTQAIEAADRAVELAPADLEHRKIRDLVHRYNVVKPDARPDYPWWHIGKYTR